MRGRLGQAGAHQIGHYGWVRRGSVGRREPDEFAKPFGFRRRGRSVVGVFLLLAAGGVAIFALTREPHVGGDPGGRIMAVLTQTDVAIPPDADIEARRDDGPHWDSCDGREGTEGWGDVFLQVYFSSSRQTSEILARADDALAVQGWSRTRLLEAGEAAWTTSQRRVTARAILRFDYFIGKWILVATAPPVGRRVSGC